MTVRSIKEIEKAFREMGVQIPGQSHPAPPGLAPRAEPTGSASQVFIRIENNTDPLEESTDADLA